MALQTELADAITAGLEIYSTRPELRLVRSGGRTVADVVIRARAVRVYLRRALPDDAPAELRRAVVGTKSAACPQVLVVTDEAGVRVARALLAYVTVAAPKPAPAAKAPAPPKAELREVKGGKATPAARPKRQVPDSRAA